MDEKTHGDRIKAEIIAAVLRQWVDDPEGITVRSIAKECNLTHGAVLYHFGTVANLRKAAAVAAVATGESRVIAQLIATRNPLVADMNEKTRRKHLVAAGV